jgi:hypothetical protein
MKKALLLLAFVSLGINANANTIQPEKVVTCDVYVNYYNSNGQLLFTIVRPANPGEECGESINISAVKKSKGLQP